MSAFFFGHPRETDLALFAGGEAGPFARWRIERHLETCKECEQTVADFFHLADELSPLADVPDVDWSAMARNIEARLAVEGPATGQSRGMPAWTWQLGAAAACAMVAVAVWNVRPQAERAYAPAVAEEAVVDTDQLAKASAQKPAEPAEARGDRNEAAQSLAAQNAADRDTAASARQLARRVSAPMPSLEKKKEDAAPVTIALAERVEERFSTDAAAPPPPPAMKATAETEADLLVAEQRRSREVSQVGGRLAAGASAPGLGFASGAAVSFADVTEQEPVAFAVMPLPAAGSDMRVGADGWISVRAIGADGAMTITDVYEPQ